MKNLRLFVFFTLLIASNTCYIQATNLKTYSKEEVFNEIKNFLSTNTPNLKAFLKKHEPKLKKINLQDKEKIDKSMNLYDFLKEIENKTNSKKLLQELELKDFTSSFFRDNKICRFLVENNLVILVQKITQINKTNSKRISTKQDTNLASIAGNSLVTRYVLQTTTESDDSDAPDEPTEGNTNPSNDNEPPNQLTQDNSNYDSLLDDDTEPLHSHDKVKEKVEDTSSSNDNETPNQLTQDNSNYDSLLDDDTEPLHSNDKAKEKVEDTSSSNDNETRNQLTQDNSNYDSLLDDDTESLHSNDKVKEKVEDTSSSNDNDAPDEPTQGNSNNDSLKENIPLFDDNNIELELLHSHTKTMNKDEYDGDSEDSDNEILDENNEGSPTKGYLDDNRSDTDENVNNSYHSEHSMDYSLHTASTVHNSHSIPIVYSKKPKTNDIESSYSDSDNNQDNVSTTSQDNFTKTSNMHNNRVNPYKSSSVSDEVVDIKQERITIFFSYKGNLKNTSINIAFYSVDKEANIAIKDFFNDHKINDLEPSEYTLVWNKNNKVAQLNNLEDLKSKTEKDCYITLKSNSWIGQYWQTFKGLYNEHQISTIKSDNEYEHKNDTTDKHVTLHMLIKGEEYTLGMDYMYYNSDPDIMQAFFRSKNITNINPLNYTIVKQSKYGEVVPATKNNLSDKRHYYIIQRTEYRNVWSNKTWYEFINNWQRILESNHNSYGVSKQYAFDTSLLHNNDNNTNNNTSPTSIRSISPMFIPPIPILSTSNRSSETNNLSKLILDDDKQQKRCTIHFETKSGILVLDNSFNTDYDIINAFFKNKRIRNKNPIDYKLIYDFAGEVYCNNQGTSNIDNGDEWYILPKEICIDDEPWTKQVQPYLDRFKQKRLQARILDLDPLTNNSNIGFIDNVHSDHDSNNSFTQPDQSRESVDVGSEESIVIDDIVMDDTEEDIDNPPLQNEKSSFISFGVVFCSVFYLIKKCRSKGQTVLSPQTENTMDLVVRCASEEVK